MFCQNCGSNNPNGAMFCENCGSKLPAATPAHAETSASWSAPGWSGSAPVSAPTGMAYATAGGYGKSTTAANNNALKMIIVIALVAVIAVAGVLGACALFGGGGYEKPIGYIEDAFNKRDVEILFKAYPDDFQDILKENENYGKFIGASNNFEQIEKEYGTDAKMKCEVVSKVKCTDSEVQELEESYNAMMQMMYESQGKSYDKVDVKKAYRLTVTQTIEGERKTETKTEEVEVGKIGGKWYLLE